MKYLVIILILITGVLAYVRVKQPQIWNTCLNALVASDDKFAATTDNSSTNVAPIPDATPTPSPPKDTPTIISPDSTNYLNPDHIRQVAQPGEAPATSTAATGSSSNSPSATVPAPVINAPTTTMPETNAPAANKSMTKASVSKPIPKSIPSTITTLSGKTYTGCVLSRVTPDGITFIHSSGGAKVLFSDLDPKFAADFNYDPVAAKKYAAEEAAKEAQSDVQRNAAIASAPSNPPPAETQVASTEPAPPQLSDADRAAIQDQIDALNSDIAFMRREVAKEEGAAPLSSGPVVPGNSTGTEGYYSSGGATHGAYADKIVQDQRQVAELQKKLQ